MDDLCKDRNHDGLRELASGLRLGVVAERVGIFDGPREWMGQDVALVAIRAQDAHKGVACTDVSFFPCQLCLARPACMRCIYCRDEACLRCMEVKHMGVGSPCQRRMSLEQDAMNSTDVPEGPNCGTFDAPVCLVDLTPDDSPVKRICGRLLPCEEHR